MKTFKVGDLELPLLNLKGKDYLAVQARVLWFRTTHPSWTLETEIISHTENYSVVKATVKNDENRIIAQGTKTESKQGFQDHLEKAESGAIGRALGFAGFGTLFAQELDEGQERIVDTPQPPPTHKAAHMPMGVSNNQPVPEKISDPQAKRLFAISKQAGWPTDKLKQFLKDQFDINSTKDILWQDYTEICRFIQNNPMTQQTS